MARALTWLQVKLAEVLRRAERHHHHTVALHVLSRGHLEGEVGAGDQAVLLNQRVYRLYPAVPEVNPGQTHAVWQFWACLCKFSITISDWEQVLAILRGGAIKTGMCLVIDFNINSIFQTSLTAPLMKARMSHHMQKKGFNHQVMWFSADGVLPERSCVWIASLHVWMKIIFNVEIRSTVWMGTDQNSETKKTNYQSHGTEMKITLISFNTKLNQNKRQQMFWTEVR